jgi:hypothetical protein
VLLPGLAVLFILAVAQAQTSFDTQKQLSHFTSQTFSGLLLFLALCASVLLSTNPSDSSVYPLLDELLHKGARYDLHDLLMKLPDLEVTKALLNPFAATHRIYDVWPAAQSGLSRLYVFLMLAGVPLFSILLWMVPILRKKSWKPLMLYALFWLHHVILAFPWLILSALSLSTLLRDAQSPSARMIRNVWIGWLGLFFTINLFWFALFPSQHIQSSDDPSKERVNAFLYSEELASRYFYVITDWGMYFYQGLYGPKNQGVLYVSGIYKQEDFDALRTLADRYHRKLLFIVDTKAKTTDMSVLHSKLKLMQCKAMDPNGAWQILLEDDGNEEIENC